MGLLQKKHITKDLMVLTLDIHIRYNFYRSEKHKFVLYLICIIYMYYVIFGNNWEYLIIEVNF